MIRDEPPERKGEAWGMLDFSELRISLNQLGRPQSGAGKPVSFFSPQKEPIYPRGPLRRGCCGPCCLGCSGGSGMRHMRAWDEDLCSFLSHHCGQMLHKQLVGERPHCGEGGLWEHSSSHRQPGSRERGNRKLTRAKHPQRPVPSDLFLQ